MRIESSASSPASDKKYVRYGEASSETAVTHVIKIGAISSESGQVRKDIFKFESKQKQKETIKDNIEGKFTDVIKLQILEKMLKAMKELKIQGLKSVNCEVERLSEGYENSIGNLKSKLCNTQIITGIPRQTLWKQKVVASAFFVEMENTAFEASGVVNTADGRTLNFGVSIEMTRAFCEKYTSISTQEYISTDPLVINLNVNNANFSDQKFLFDIDSDTEESISLAEKGSEFLNLAVDSNDMNNWIEEIAAVFGDLKIWSKDDNGNDVIINFNDAGIGAIDLNKTSTEFSMKNTNTNQANGFLRNSGIYLKESAEAGQIQHVDLTV